MFGKHALPSSHHHKHKHELFHQPKVCIFLLIQLMQDLEHKSITNKSILSAVMLQTGYHI